jgi:hypothetical protein
VEQKIRSDLVSKYEQLSSENISRMSKGLITLRESNLTSGNNKVNNWTSKKFQMKTKFQVKPKKEVKEKVADTA